MHVFLFILKITPIIGTFLLSIEVLTGRLNTGEKLSLKERRILGSITSTLWGMDILGIFTAIVLVGIFPLFLGFCIRLCIQIYFSFGKNFLKQITNQNNNQTNVTAKIGAEQQEIQNTEYTLSQNQQVAQLEQEYLNLKEEQEKQQYLEKLKESEEENMVAQVAYNRLTNDKDRVTKQPESSPNPKPNSTKINPNSIPSSVSGEYNKTQNELRPHKTEGAIKDARLSRAQDARLAGQIALQKQKQEQKQVEQILEVEKGVVDKKEQGSEKKIVSLIKDTLTQKLDKAA